MIPAVGSNVTLPVTLTSAYGGQNGDDVIVNDGTHWGVYEIVSGAGTTSVHLKYVAFLTVSFTGNTMAAGATMGAYMNAVSANYFEVDVVNGPNPGTAYGIIVQDAWFYGGNTFLSLGSWGDFFGTNGASVHAIGGGALLNTVIQLDDGDIPAFGYNDFAGFRSTIPGYGFGNQVLTWPTAQIGAQLALFQAVAGHGAAGQAAFAETPQANRIPLQVNVTALAAGTALDVYAFSPFALGASKTGARFFPTQMSTNAGGSIQLVACEDETTEAGSDGLQYPTQIHLRFYNPTAGAITTTIYGGLEVGT